MSLQLDAVVTEIRSLLDRPAEPRPERAIVERTLTDGYAYALGLEAERLRAERRLRGLPADGVSEREELERRTAATRQELADLRALLSTLRAHALD